jgi:aromatic ring-opening dioxygenase LigB subunit
VLHGALGQLFYKKIIATKVWGSVMPLSFFPAYCAIVLLSAAAVQKFFLVSCGSSPLLFNTRIQFVESAASVGLHIARGSHP